MLKALFLGLLFLGQLMATETDLKLLISKEQIDSRIKEVAQQIDQEYQGKEIVLVMVMKGAIFVTADLMSEIKVPCTLEYVKASSYGQNGTVNGALKLKGIEDLSLKGKHVIVIDDIFDTGTTMTAIKNQLLLQEPASLKTLVLLVKNRPRSLDAIVPDYVLFPIEDEFVVGYGLDYKEQHRGLKGVYAK